MRGGGAGNVIIGSAGPNVLYGGAGTDRISGGGGDDEVITDGGLDEVDGGPGHDRVSMGDGAAKLRDGVADRIFCTGRVRVIADRVDRLSYCAPRLSLWGRRRLRSTRKGTVTIGVRCLQPRGPGGPCRGSVRVVLASGGPNLAFTRVVLRPALDRVVTLTLTPAARRLLRRSGTQTVRVASTRRPQPAPNETADLVTALLRAPVGT